MQQNPQFPADVSTLPVRIAFVRPGARDLYAEGGGLPAPATPHAAGIDLRACLDAAEARVAPGARMAVPVGISIQPVAPGWAGFIYSRRGLRARDGLTVAQGVGLIDPDYTGEIRVFLQNTSGEERLLRRGERVAQLVFQPYARPVWEEVAELAPTERGAGGFGHTGR